jgi:hypothetical protein
MAGSARAPAPSAELPRHALRSYRYTFFDRPDDDRALAALVLLADSDEDAGELAKQLLEKSDAAIVEVWSDGRLVVRMGK